VLAVFMGGLAAGSFWLGRRADRSPRPLVLYGWLEIGIGVCGLLFPWCYVLCHRAYVGLARGWQPGGGANLALQLAFCMLAILLPSVLMGGTLPVLAKLMTRSVAEVRGKVAALYAINSAGAVAGCLLADFWLVPAAGLRATIFWAVGMNVI